ncbi:MAG: diguanylate cyclase, partial [Alphaproteobacteria bacterium]|nr:diguanylate cyclase [Alphaproteobacteria bacterium]
FRPGNLSEAGPTAVSRFNDKYGFRQGDRAIILFSELLRRELTLGASFCGHIGGDDFVLAFKETSMDDAIKTVERVRDDFTNGVVGFYDEEARCSGFILARDRHGIERSMPLLSVSAGVVSLPRGRPPLGLDHLVSRLAGLKKAAKEDRRGISCVVLDS